MTAVALRPAEVCYALGVDLAGFAHLIESGQLPAFAIGSARSRSYRVRECDLAEYIARRLTAVAS